MKQVTVTVEDSEYELFQRITVSIGATPSDALRMFICAFNDCHGFPFAVQSRRMQYEPFETAEAATRFATDLAKKMYCEAR